jgi:FkbM family methyltransferase
MQFTLFRLLLLGWNNAPDWVRAGVRGLGLTRLVHEVWMPYRNLLIPPSERPVRQLIENLTQPGWRCADVGANFGMMTEVMARCAGTAGQVMAFEAHPLNASILRRRMQAQGLDPIVRVENMAASDGSIDLLQLYAGRRRSPNEWNVMGKNVEGRTTPAVMEIPATSLDAYFGTRPLDLVKIDVEGAEVLVIAGMRQLLTHQKPVCLVEFHSAQAWESRRVFLEAGYGIYRLDGARVSEDAALEAHVLCWPPGSLPPDRLWSIAPETRA